MMSDVSLNSGSFRADYLGVIEIRLWLHVVNAERALRYEVFSKETWDQDH